MSSEKYFNDHDMLSVVSKCVGAIRGDMGIGYWLDGTEWNPLKYEADALHLAVMFKMVVDTDYNGGANAGNAYVGFEEPAYIYQYGTGLVDISASTMLAIVRCAYENCLRGTM
jgi:hypothetical protein